MSELVTQGGMPPVPVFLHEGRATTSSRDVAEFFGKEHKNVLQAIERLDCSAEFNRLNFQPVDYLDARNRAQRMYRMTRDGFTFLAMGFTGARAAQFKEGFIAAFNAMEEQLRGGAALPELAGAVAALVARQDMMERKVDAILDLVDVTKRYVQLLETNQKPAKRTQPYARITPELVAEVNKLFAEGWTTTDVARHLNISRTAAHTIKHAQHPLQEPAQ